MKVINNFIETSQLKSKILLKNYKKFITPIDTSLGIEISSKFPFLWATMFINFLIYFLTFFFIFIGLFFLLDDLVFLNNFSFILLVISYLALFFYTSNLFIRKTKYELITSNNSITKVIIISCFMFMVYFVCLSLSHVFFKIKVDSLYTSEEFKKIDLFDDKIRVFLSKYNYLFSEDEIKYSNIRKIRIINKRIEKENVDLQEKYLKIKDKVLGNYRFLNKNNKVSISESEIFSIIYQIKGLKDNFLYTYYVLKKEIILFVYFTFLLSITSNIFNLNFLKSFAIVGSIVIPNVFLFKYISFLSIPSFIITLFIYYMFINKYLNEILYYILLLFSLILYLKFDSMKEYFIGYLFGISIFTLFFYFGTVRKKLLAPC